MCLSQPLGEIQVLKSYLACQGRSVSNLMGSVGLLIYHFPLMYNSNHISIFYHLAVILVGIFPIPILLLGRISDPPPPRLRFVFSKSNYLSLVSERRIPPRINFTGNVLFQIFCFKDRHVHIETNPAPQSWSGVEIHCSLWYLHNKNYTVIHILSYTLVLYVKLQIVYFGSLQMSFDFQSVLWLYFHKKNDFFFIKVYVIAAHTSCGNGITKQGCLLDGEWGSRELNKKKDSALLWRHSENKSLAKESWWSPNTRWSMRTSVFLFLDTHC